MGRILSLDIGTKRIGLAITDESQTIAQPFDFTASPAEIGKLMTTLTSDYEIEKIIVGLPMTMAGEEGFQVEYTKKIAEKITEETGMPVEYFDERLTTKQAYKLEGGGGIPIDCLAAQQLLEQYLRKV
ncbi:MAG TPA: Holliday junction resolvase RuvX [Flavobacterium sp.]|nr:Holliday junction resolvase RuvX [Flavobacterium sp.]